MDFDFRFGGIKRLYGASHFERIRAAHICVIGVGGVGSWSAEALARSGVGKITLIDYDDICESNFNRQIHALEGNIGKQKIDVMKQRLEQISPGLEFELHHERFDADTAESLLSHSFSVVIDATDQLLQKCILINECQRQKTPVVVSGGSAGKADPAQIVSSDLVFSKGDKLLYRVRKKLRQDYGFSRDTKKPLGIPCVFSEEEPSYPLESGEVTKQPESRLPMPLDCNSGMGSSTFVTGTFGFVAAAEALKLV